MVKTVMVTGASGFIGKQTINTLENAGLCVIQGIRKPKEYEKFKNNILIDLNNPGQILALKEKLHCEAIVHLGARVGWTGETDFDLFIPNVISSGCIAYLARVLNAHLIFASAAIIHGIKAEYIQPNTVINPDTAYGRSKLIAEQLIQTSGVNHCILRIAGVFGNNGPKHLGLNRAIAGAMRGEIPVQVGSGQALRNYIYVKDVAKIISYVIETELTGVHYVAGCQELSINQMLQSICDTFLPDKKPLIMPGSDATNKIVRPSNILPKTRSFQEALIDIKRENKS